MTITSRKYQQWHFLTKHFDKWRERYATKPKPDASGKVDLSNYFPEADTPEKYMSIIANKRHGECDPRVRWM
ncbi:MAG: hypothetical protein ACE5FT_05050 [Candidatus Nanoarchaeia archaeon]